MRYLGILVLIGIVVFSPSMGRCWFAIPIPSPIPECVACWIENLRICIAECERNTGRCAGPCGHNVECVVACISQKCAAYGETVPIELNAFEVTAQEGAIRLSWTTASETENLGYHIYRSLNKDGPYEKLTTALIEGAGSSRTAQTYEFIDQDVQEAMTYFYKLEQIDFDGTREVHGPMAVIVGEQTALQPSTWAQVKALLK